MIKYGVWCYRTDGGEPHWTSASNLMCSEETLKKYRDQNLRFETNDINFAFQHKKDLEKDYSGWIFEVREKI